MENFPAQWEWVALILGGVAFLMAVQPFTQAIWGNPRIKIEFHQFIDNGVKYLSYEISNKPIYGGILGKLAVYRRTAEGLCTDFYIYDSTGKQCIIEQLHADLVIGGVTHRQLSLPASGLVWATVDAVKTNAKGSSFVVTTPNLTPIPIGLYSLLVVVTYEGRKLEQNKFFTIGDAHDKTYWVSSL